MEEGLQEDSHYLTFEETRVLGSLVEKAIVTPENYPLSLNALANACNQKTSRHPQTDLSYEEVEEALDSLRFKGFVMRVDLASSRIPRYQHKLSESLILNKGETALLVVLMLRGPQTVGELRSRAARMEPIADLATLQPILVTLQEKGLVVPLTTAGRGQKVTHGLYQDAERPPSPQSSHQGLSEPAGKSESLLPTVQMATPPAVVTVDMYNELQVELAELQAEVSRLKGRIEELEIVETEPPSGGP